MTWSYSYAGGSSKDEVRFLVGDIDANQPLLSNEDISYLVTRFGSAVKAAPEAAMAIARKFAMQADIADPALRVSYTARAQHYFTLAKDLRTEARRVAFVAPYAGGISVSDKDLRASDTDRVDIGVGLGYFDNPEVGDSETHRSL